jgi:ketosteroid isomerase-like protein
MTHETSRLPRSRRLWPIVLITGVLGLAAGVGVAALLDQGADADPGTEVSDAVMTAWATADPDDIKAIYADDALFVLDGESVASGVDRFIDMIPTVANTYRTVGPVTSYEAADGDLYVTALVVATGPPHPNGVPVVGFYRVHDGKVIRHVFMDAEHY